jgi:hypothetical protein
MAVAKDGIIKYHGYSIHIFLAAFINKTDSNTLFPLNARKFSYDDAGGLSVYCQECTLFCGGVKLLNRNPKLILNPNPCLEGLGLR